MAWMTRQSCLSRALWECLRYTAQGRLPLMQSQLKAAWGCGLGSLVGAGWVLITGFMVIIVLGMEQAKSSAYCDLGLSAERAIDIGHLLNKIKVNGYSTVALNYQLTDPKQPPPPKKDYSIPGLSVLHRITYTIDNPASLHPLNQSQAPFACDILAVKATNQKIFHTLCTEYQSYDIITFDLGNKLPFMLKRNPVYEAIRKGKHFEISYEHMFDESVRVIAMTNIINIIKATSGKNLIVSSHATEAGLQRTPYDVGALLMSLGMDKNAALAAVGANCGEVVRNGQHRLYLKGAIQEIPRAVGVKIGKRIQKHREGLKKIKQKMEENKMKNQTNS